VRTPAGLGLPASPFVGGASEAALAPLYLRLAFEHCRAVGVGAQSTLPHAPVFDSTLTSCAVGGFQLDI